MTDQKLIERALRAGWVWFVGKKDWPGTPQYPATGWQEGTSTFHNCNVEDKANLLRGSGKDHNTGFDHDHDCCECGKPIWLSWMRPTSEELISRKECFNCNHWLSLVRGGDGVIIEKSPGHRSHYTIGAATRPGHMNGFGGCWFTIRFRDGRVVKTCDLWHQGEIPERFYDRLPVNAEFVRDE